MALSPPSMDMVAVTVAALFTLAAPTRSRLLAAGAGTLLAALALAGLRSATAGGERLADLPRSFQLITLALVVVGDGLVLLALAGRRPAPGPAAVPVPIVIPRERWLTLHILAVLGAVVAPGLHLFLLLVLTGTIAGFCWSRPGRVPLVLGPALLLLAGCWYLLAQVAGPMPLLLAQLREAPYSAAFELGVAGALLAVAATLLGLAPFHLIGRGPLTPILGALLLVRLTAVAVPGGLVHWQPIFFPIALVTTLLAAVARRPDLALLGVAAVGVGSGDPVAGWCGVLVVVLVVVFRGRDWLERTGRRLALAGWGVLVTVVAAAGGALVPALAGGLAAETVYTALIALSASAAFLATAWRLRR
ncbi:MAG: hypothetical protein SF070_02405 [Gemmatimonadota bacterium]|nr:hypothetical protein [Gemmatimonadota bacterium]